jgi:hypothetical protein
MAEPPQYTHYEYADDPNSYYENVNILIEDQPAPIHAFTRAQ